MTTKKYYYDPTAETLTVVEFDESGEIVGISELSEPYVLRPIGREEAEQEEEEEEPTAPSFTDEQLFPKRRGPRKCSVCGQPGHTVRTCPKSTPQHFGMEADDTAEDDGESRPPAGVHKSLRQQIMEQRAEGVSLDEMYELFPDHEMAEIAAVYRNIEQEENRI